tara:strand:- start:540 stop:710 length:171 start_codon:yes stop_codon:yes gene_type:complete
MNTNLLTKDEVTESLKISRGTLDKWIKNKEIKYVKFDRSVRFREEDVNEYINSKLV